MNNPLVKSEKAESIRLIGVVVEAIREPSGDSFEGTYDIPFQLSQVASPEWEQEFLKAWDRVGVKGQIVTASVGAEQIILNMTTIDEVERIYLDQLKRAVAEANLKIQQQQERERYCAELEEEKRRERRRHILDVVKRLNFQN